MFTAENQEPFPAGLRVLVVDDDPTSLLLLQRLLLACHYQVTKCQRARDALSLLRGNKGSFDIVMSDLYMPDIDGLQLLEIIGLEMDLPVVMMSSEDRRDIVMKIIMKGACDYLIKPIRMEEVRVIWQHVVRKRRNNSKSYMLSKFLDSGRADQQEDHSSNFETKIQGNRENNRSSNCGKDEKEHKDHNKDVLIASQKKPRMVWTDELHDQFVAVVNQMGLKNAVPKKILEHMKVPGLTRENVASHLQKHRLNLRKENEKIQMKSRVGVAPIHLQNAAHPPCLEDISNSQAYAISKQLESQSSVFSESEAERLSINAVVGAPLDEQISHYNQRLTSQHIFETGRQQSWYHGTEVINHLPPHEHNTSTTIVAEPAQDGFVLERLMQSSVGMERSNELVRNGVLNPDDFAAAAYEYDVTMSSLDQHENEVEIEDAQTGSNFVVNSRDFDYAFSRYEPIFLFEQQNQELPMSSSSQQSTRGHLEVNSTFEF